MSPANTAACNAQSMYFSLSVGAVIQEILSDPARMNGNEWKPPSIYSFSVGLANSLFAYIFLTPEATPSGWLSLIMINLQAAPDDQEGPLNFAASRFSILELDMTWWIRMLDVAVDSKVQQFNFWSSRMLFPTGHDLGRDLRLFQLNITTARRREKYLSFCPSFRIPLPILFKSSPAS
ncbi:hypothetical protein B0H13DRAFT_1877013 [Mycena leptocephala]|nr:hypothetical protein B0H13DRAFT_1877013 [Mycena leptocephala]